MQNLGFITTTRQDLFDVAAILSGGISPEFMQDPENPVIFSVRGTGGGGKKIIFDGMLQSMFGIEDARQKDQFCANPVVEKPAVVAPQPQSNMLTRITNRLFRRKEKPVIEHDEPVINSATEVLAGLEGSHTRFVGKDGTDEYWVGCAKDSIVELTYSDAMYACSWDSSLKGFRASWLAADPHKAAAFTKLRTRGGITVVQNGFDYNDDLPWVTVHLEKHGKPVINGGPCRYESASEKMKYAFKLRSKMAGGLAERVIHPEPHWTRYLEIRVHKPELLVSQQFQRAMQALQDKGPIFGQQAGSEPGHEFSDDRHALIPVAV